jgi:hypothetical protein
MGQSSFRSQPAGLDQTDYRDQLANELRTRGEVQKQQEQSRNQQTEFAQRLLAQSQGQGPSVADEKLKIGQDRLSQQLAAALAQSKGLNAGSNARLAGRAGAQGGQDLVNQSALARAQEQLATQALLGNVIAQRRQGDVASSEGDLQRLFTLGQLQNSQNVNTANNFNKAQAINADIEQRNASVWSNAIGGAIQGGASMLGGGMLGGGGGGAPQSTGIPVTSSSSVQMPNVSFGQSAPGGSAYTRGYYSVGGEVAPEAAAPEPGDHPANDIVPAMVSPGEVVLPRTVASNPEKAKKFIEALNKKNKPQDEFGYAKVLSAKKAVEELEKFYCGGMVK